MIEPRRSREQRRTPRIAVDFPAKLICDRKQYSCSAREFSEFGILVESKNKELVGKDVDLNLILDSPENPFSLQGIVAYSTETALGVRFSNLTSEAQTTLRGYIHNHEAKASKYRVEA